jgi:hypothetical protein
MITIRIHWGSESTRQETPTVCCTYQFRTQEEMDAFMSGVEEAIGWMDYLVVEEEEEST